MIEDLDGKGDVGLTFWVKGVYEDKDGDGTWDVCQNTRVTITESPEVNNSWEWAELLDGNFYNEKSRPTRNVMRMTKTRITTERIRV